MTRGASNIEIGRARSQDELLAAFREATLVCVPLLPNLHASGITVIQEAVLAGAPVVATDTGGLDAYFARDEIDSPPPATRARCAQRYWNSPRTQMRRWRKRNAPRRV